MRPRTWTSSPLCAGAGDKARAPWVAGLFRAKGRSASTLVAALRSSMYVPISRVADRAGTAEQTLKKGQDARLQALERG